MFIETISRPRNIALIKMTIPPNMGDAPPILSLSPSLYRRLPQKNPPKESNVRKKEFKNHQLKICSKKNMTKPKERTTPPKIIM